MLLISNTLKSNEWDQKDLNHHLGLSHEDFCGIVAPKSELSREIPGCGWECILKYNFEVKSGSLMYSVGEIGE